MRLFVLALVLPALAAGGIPSIALQSPRAAHTATLLRSGEVLVVGGCTVDSCELDERGATTELFDPRRARFVTAGRIDAALAFATATRLKDGRVLVVGGYDDRIDVSDRAWIVRTG